MLSSLSTSNSENVSLKKFVFKLFFFAPLVFVLFLDSLLPVDFFNRRTWESLLVMRQNPVLSGYFYPNMELTKSESAADLDFHHGKSVKRNNEWITDFNGYRKKFPYALPLTIVVVGDSNMAGSGLSQPELFSEVLEQKLGTGVYPLAPAGLASVFLMPHFQTRPPKVVIASFIERTLTQLPRYAESPRQKMFTSIPLFQKGMAFWANIMSAHPALGHWAVFVDRFFYKKTLAQFMKARIFFRPAPPQAAEGGFPMYFLQGDAANEDVPEALLQSAVETFKSYHEACAKRGIRFIFMPIPNKESIYYDLLLAKKKPVFLKQLLARLGAQGIETIDLSQAFEDFRTRYPDILLYNPEDSHWGPAGVRVAAEAAAKVLS